MTGQREVECLCKRLRASLNDSKSVQQKGQSGGAERLEPAKEGDRDAVGLEDCFGVDAVEDALEDVHARGSIPHQEHKARWFIGV